LTNLTNVLFVCIGNSCRSQMAEGFARKYGSDVLSAWSGGVAPAPIVQPLTTQVMLQRNIDIQEQFPKSIHELELNAFDLIINMSGAPMPVGLRAEVREWTVSDPMTQAEEVYLRVRDQIEGLVMSLILTLRKFNATLDVAAVPVIEKPAPAWTQTTPTSSKTSVDDRSSQSSQRYGFGRVRRTRD
jgi:arsenate reductase